MPERYPDDAALLALTMDPDTGVEHIPTGRSPYFLEFRKLVQRLILAAGRANDLRIYQDGDLSVGMRPGRCFLAGSALVVSGVGGLAADANAATDFWLDSAGAIQSSTSGLPADRTAFIPLARVSAGPSAITEVVDLRGEVFLAVPNLGTLGINVAAAALNNVFDGLNVSANATALNILAGGPGSTADNEHRHLQVLQDANAEVFFTLLNDSAGAAANVGLAFGLANMPADTELLPNLANGFLCQRYGTTTYNLVGTVHAQFGWPGNLTATQNSLLMGAVPIDGVVSAVVLSLGTNLVSNVGADAISAVVKVNGTAVTTTHPAITSAAGSGFRSTARGQGAPGAIKTDGTQNVQRGDVLTVDLVRNVSGTVSTQAANIVVLVVIRANQPE